MAITRAISPLEIILVMPIEVPMPQDTMAITRATLLGTVHSQQLRTTALTLPLELTMVCSMETIVIGVIKRTINIPVIMFIDATMVKFTPPMHYPKTASTFR